MRSPTIAAAGEARRAFDSDLQLLIFFHQLDDSILSAERRRDDEEIHSFGR